MVCCQVLAWVHQAIGNIVTAGLQWLVVTCVGWEKFNCCQACSCSILLRQSCTGIVRVQVTRNIHTCLLAAAWKVESRGTLGGTIALCEAVHALRWHFIIGGPCGPWEFGEVCAGSTTLAQGENPRLDLVFCCLAARDERVDGNLTNIVAGVAGLDGHRAGKRIGICERGSRSPF